MLVSDVVATDLPDDFRADKQLYSSCLAGAISEEAYIAGLKKAGLGEIEVRERFVYDVPQLQAFVGSELRTEELNSANDWAQKLQGKIWSVKIFAQKTLEI